MRGDCGVLGGRGCGGDGGDVEVKGWRGMSGQHAGEKRRARDEHEHIYKSVWV